MPIILAFAAGGATALWLRAELDGDGIPSLMSLAVLGGGGYLAYRAFVK